MRKCCATQKIAHGMMDALNEPHIADAGEVSFMSKIVQQPTTALRVLHLFILWFSIIHMITSSQTFFLKCGKFPPLTV